MDYKNVHGGSLSCSPTQEHLILRFRLKRNKQWIHHFTPILFPETFRELAMCAHPAVKILPLFGLPHPLDVRGEDVKECREHGVRLWPARMFGEQAVHDGGALNDEPGDVLQRVTRLMSARLYFHIM